MKFPKDKKNLILYAPFSKKAWRGEGGVKTWTQEPPFFHSDSEIFYSEKCDKLKEIWAGSSPSKSRILQNIAKNLIFV